MLAMLGNGPHARAAHTKKPSCAASLALHPCHTFATPLSHYGRTYYSSGCIMGSMPPTLQGRAARGRPRLRGRGRRRPGPAGGGNE
jgi:hypothetical protein